METQWSLEDVNKYKVLKAYTRGKLDELWKKEKKDTATLEFSTYQGDGGHSTELGIAAAVLCWLHEISDEKIESFPLQLSGLLTTDMDRECGLWECSCHPRQKLTDHDSNISLVRSFHQGK